MSTEDIDDNLVEEYCDCGYDDCHECSPENFDEDGYNTQSGGEIGNKYDTFRSYLKSKGFEKIGNGSFRVTYRRGEIVIKVPRNVDGEIDNMVEAAGWRKYKSSPTDDGIPLAPCRLLVNGCLMMRKVDMTYIDRSHKNFQWVEKIEGHQVGEYRGKLVAYDYALSLNEREEWEENWGVESQFYKNGW